MASILKVDAMQGVTAAGDITITDGATTFKMQSALNKMWITSKLQVVPSLIGHLLKKLL